MKYFEYFKQRRRLKWGLYRNKIQNRARVQDEVAAAEMRELQRQSKCSHDFHFKTSEKKWSDGISNSISYDLVIICKHCGKIIIR